MSPAREAFGLPLTFLTVILLAGVRVTDRVALVPASLSALVLGLVLVGALFRGGVVHAPALLHGSRTPAENVSGAIVIATLFAASAQALNLLIPDSGLLHAAFAIFVFCQLLTIGAAHADRAGSLRSLAVLFGSLFVLRFILLESLYKPGSGLLHRLLTAAMAGASLGGIQYEPHAAVTGYVAFFTLALYVLALLFLPSARPLPVIRRSAGLDVQGRTALPLILAVALAGSSACRKADSPASAAEPGRPKPAGSGLVTPAQRSAALRAARVWEPPRIPIGRARLGQNPDGPGRLGEEDDIECRLVVKAMGGTTPKFDCEREDNDVIRVKYGRGNPELHAEVAATRLLAALGFGADRMYAVRRVRCAGCPMFPFQALKCLSETGMQQACFAGGIDYSKSTDFDHVSIERRFEGRRLEATADQGWSFYEIDQIDERAGGSPKAHVDALKLLAVFLAHWDNKGENQRLLCLPGGDLPDGGCSRPFAILQDLGASFGPYKLDIHNWRSNGVWTDPRACRVSMKHLPFQGATFPDARISEAGRQFLLSLLQQLTQGQIEELFAGARVELSEGITAEGRQPSAWAAAFADKVRQIREAGPCGG